MPPVPWRVRVTNHPGSTREDIEREPDWAKEHKHDHRVGFRNRYDRVPGVTHAQDEDLSGVNNESGEAHKEYEQLKERARKGDLVNFRDIVQNEKDLYLRHPENRSLGWRYVLQFTEDWIRNQ